MIAGFSENAGRRPAYIACFAITIGSNLALALQSNYPALLVLRMVQAAGSAGTVALSYSVVADCITSAERGRYIGWASISTMLGPALAPVLGGILSQYAGWHWIFWFTLILTGAIAVPLFLFLPETCRRIVDNGSIPPPALNKPLIQYFRRGKTNRNDIDGMDGQPETPKITLKFPNPLATLKILRFPQTALVLIAGALPAACLYAIMTGIPSILGPNYHLSTVKIGLAYLPFGFGSLVSSFTAGRLVDWNYRRHARRLGFPLVKNRETDLRNFPLEQARLEGAIPLQALGAAGILAWGWVLDAHVNLAGPLVFLGISGFCVVGLFQVTSVLLVDLHPEQPATASAASNLVRGLLGAGASAAVGPMIESALGVGWTYTIVGGILAAFCPVLWALMVWGPNWRRARLDELAKASTSPDSGTQSPKDDGQGRDRDNEKPR